MVFLRLAFHVETHRLNLRASQHELLERIKVLACRFYNAALEERISNWRHGLLLASRRGLPSPNLLSKAVWQPVTRQTQFAALTKVRADDPEGYGAVPANVMREVLVRLDLAFQRFFDRVATGREKPGFPRFKSIRRWRSIGWNEMNGIRIEGNRLLFAAFGEGRTLRFKRHRDWPEDAEPCSVRLVRKAHRWEAHVQVEFAIEGEVVRAESAKVDKSIAAAIDDPEIATLWLKEARAVERRKVEREYAIAKAADDERRKAAYLAALDAGTARGWDANIENLATNDLGERIENPRIGREHGRRRSHVEEEIAKSTRGTCRWRKAVRRLRRLREREANARRTQAHQDSRRIVRQSAFNAFEELDLRNMTRSAAGTVEEPGTNVAQKSGLNREVLDGAHGRRLTYVRYKAARAGGWTVVVPPHGTTSSCSDCKTKGRPDDDRIFRCVACGLEMDRDRNAAVTVRNRSRGVVAPGAKARKDQGKVRRRCVGISS